MSRVFKRVRGRDSQQKKSQVWHLEFKDHMDIKHRLAGFTDKSATEALGYKIDKLIALRMAGENPDAALTKWLEECPKSVLRKLGEWGILSQERAVAGKGLEEHVGDWTKALITKGTGAARARDSYARVSKLFSACGFKSWSDIDAERIAEQLLAWRDEGTLATQTSNHYVQHTKQFCRWMVDNGRATTSPVRLLGKITVTSKRRKRSRRALTDSEFLRFVKAALVNTKPFMGFDGFTRATMYVTVRRSGLRWSELRSLSRGAFELTGRSPKVYIRDDDEKHPRGIPLPLKKDAVDMLKKYFATYPCDASDRAFPMPSRNVGADLVRHDLKLAGIPYRDENGLIYDFHSIRGQLATDMARAGVSPQKTQKAMRHSDINLTMRYYTHLTVEDQQSAFEQLPSMNIDEQPLVKPPTNPEK